MSVSPLRQSAEVEVGVGLDVKIVREKQRSRCFRCRVRRVLYRIVLASGTHYAGSEARCAECWGVR